ncbi:hypothetical protein EDD27_10278 [Nonomuraea polychroma]|uniref:PE domain-containing protein n=1 Tax=Nonomuraea polychroma TaxID=46176 RepID=A0A438MNK7_9ACTN|nr:hypothetical protein [Nonomuraea polychroma]RVX47348.1 hypothetical protein EDD27_10278 [Nonomuraea polychroma]
MSRPPESGSPPPELELPSGFPGLGEDDGGGPFIDHQEVKSVISALRESLGALRGETMPNMSATWTGPGTVNEVSYLGNVGPQEAGQWEAASAFGNNIHFAYGAFDNSYALLIEHVEKWANAVEKAIANYERFHQDSSA